MLTVSSADRDVAEAMRSGASGYLTKDLSPEALVRALRATQSGELVIPRKLAADFSSSPCGARIRCRRPRRRPWTG